MVGRSECPLYLLREYGSEPAERHGDNPVDNGYLFEGAIKSDNEKKRGTEDLKDIVVSDDRCTKVEPVLKPDTQNNIGDRNLKIAKPG